jgi:starch phosphorylase
MRTYSGGLGILAGDTVRAAADLCLPMVAVTLLHRKGYFRQVLDSDGVQSELPDEWLIEDYLAEMPQRVSVLIEGRTVWLRAWRYQVPGDNGHYVSVYFLDSDLEENSSWDRTLTHFLYGGDTRYRLCQEVILGIGGLRMLRALGFDNVERFHMNEGHSSLLTVELLEERVALSGREDISATDIEAVRTRCVFTTHTPVAAGHDRFPPDLVRNVLGGSRLFQIQDLALLDDMINLTYLALNLSRYVNGVARKHGEVSRLMFEEDRIDSITNGIHLATWTSKPMQALFDRHIPGWREDSASLRYVSSIEGEEIWEAHCAAKRRLIERVNQNQKPPFDLRAFTIGFARRATAYKRADLIFRSIERLEKMADRFGPIQLVYAGKAHPRDDPGKQLIQHIFQIRKNLGKNVRVAYLENYDIELGGLMTAGADLWLNTPQPPLEASGTSGMKAALNGVPSLSVLDGWWVEGHIEGITGWAIGRDHGPAPEGGDGQEDAEALYQKLEEVILPLFYENQKEYVAVMSHAIALNAPFFNTRRMIGEYVRKAYGGRHMDRRGT